MKDPATKRNISIHAIGLSLYESLPGTTEEQVGSEVIRTQWMCVINFIYLVHIFTPIFSGPSAKILLGRRVLIIDEVDDSRQTLQ